MDIEVNFSKLHLINWSNWSVRRSSQLWLQTRKHSDLAHTHRGLQQILLLKRITAHFLDTYRRNFDVLLTVHLSIFILVINQIHAKNLFYNKFI